MAGDMKHKIVGVLGLTLGLTLAACAPIKHAQDVETSGFLQDYSALREGKAGEALKIYIDPNYPQLCETYDKVLIEPIGIWVKENSDLADVSPSERQNLVNHLHGSLVSELGKYYQVVKNPQPGALRIRTAITEAEGSVVALDTMSSFLPHSLVISKIKETATGTATFVGRASGEVEVTDAMTGERIAAAVDAIVGTKSVFGVTSKWDDVNRAFDDWSYRLAYRLVNCGAIAPEQE